MKIISKRSDFYDIGTSMGVDETNVFVRKPEVVKLKSKNRGFDLVNEICKTKFDLYEHTSSIFIHKKVTDHLVVIGFCGKIYFGVFLEETKNTLAAIYWKRSDRFEEHLSKIEEVERTKPKRFYSINIEDLKLASDFAFSNTGKEILEPFFEYKTPIFAFATGALTKKINDYHWSVYESLVNNGVDFSIENIYRETETPILITDALLKHINFSTLVDPFTAFQEVSMFNAGVLPSSHEPPQITSDEVLRDAKGFDKMSFKKRKAT